MAQFHDTHLRSRFMRVVHMVDSPAGLFMPDVLIRVALWWPLLNLQSVWQTARSFILKAAMR